MFIIDIHYTASPEEVDKHRDGHVAYLKKYIENNTFLVTGRKVPATGGILIVNAASREEVEKIITEDTFYQSKVAEMTITEFTHARHNAILDGLLGESV
ncbi:MAG TPA: YciI family protein [Mucilaginibacter sp.]|nr:YciI family protein [Mucilaginibacter sp.]